ncbi:S1 family peptidase [Vibrio ostreicida]|uniref:Trypsin-like serine protease n=1 Tax=Vibrio ostreicida TaxID=526588 RepID=A0ABT8C210_9VIBR|nr:trypsin-like serine protease [Vibrio ostreicida]MDN3612400.1 trypsin-like serine protease [Vibrio ostreicida]NPD09831.1 trypsin-like serine protease [Vibrio ostreicida]
MARLVWCMTLLLVCFKAACLEISPYIVNGSNANIVNYPSFASLFYRNGNVYQTSSYCGATMINSQYVLTAAHCIYGATNTMLYTVVVPQLEDEANFLSTQQARALEFYYPDDYVNSSSERWPNDIAIIKLETALAVSDYSSLLNTTINNSFVNPADYKAIGHGYIEGNVAGGSRLLETSLDYISTNSCQSEFGSKLTDKQLCFGGPQSGSYQNSTCNGDSGGPVYWYNGVQYVQIGITSFGPDVCGSTAYTVTSVFTDVYDYTGWINNVINGLETPKHYVTVSNGARVLISNDGSTSSATSSGSSGGGFELGLIMGCLFLFACRRHNPSVLPPHS